MRTMGNIDKVRRNVINRRSAAHSLSLLLLLVPLFIPWIAASGRSWVEIYYEPLTPHIWYGIESMPLLITIILRNVAPNYSMFDIPLASDIAVVIAFALVGIGTGVTVMRRRGRTDWAQIAWLSAFLLLAWSWLVAMLLCIQGRIDSGSTVGFTAELSPLAGFWLAPCALITASGLRVLTRVMNRKHNDRVQLADTPSLWEPRS